jgi:nicotinamidase-related amidase
VSGTIDPSTTALLLMDFQPSTLGFLSDPGPLIDRAENAKDIVRGRGGHVGFVRVAFTDEDYAAFPVTSMMGNRVKAARPGMDAGSPTTSIHPRLGAEPKDILVRKTRVGAFSTTSLHEQLTSTGVSTLLLAGVHTSGVALTTVREAHDLDYTVVVVKDLCSDPDPDIHDFLVRKIFPKQGRVISACELPDLFG